MKILDFVQVTDSGEKAVTVPVADLVIAGWTGRDPAAMEAHMAELEAIGSHDPKQLPSSTACLKTCLPRMIPSAWSEKTVLARWNFYLALADGLWMGLGSDHTDRKVEAYNVTVSKRLARNP